MPLTAEQVALCQRLESGRPEPSAATLIRKLAKETDDLWDRLSAAYTLVRNETPEGTIQKEMLRLQAMVRQRATN